MVAQKRPKSGPKAAHKQPKSGPKAALKWPKSGRKWPEFEIFWPKVKPWKFLAAQARLVPKPQAQNPTQPYLRHYIFVVPFIVKFHQKRKMQCPKKNLHFH